MAAQKLGKEEDGRRYWRGTTGKGQEEKGSGKKKKGKGDEQKVYI